MNSNGQRVDETDLRDHFATHALNGLASTPLIAELLRESLGSGSPDDLGDATAARDGACGALAMLSYALADAMLLTRKSPGT